MLSGKKDESKKSGPGGWGMSNTFGNLGSKLRQQTEAVASKAKEAASGIERLQSQFDGNEVPPNPNQTPTKASAAPTPANTPAQNDPPIPMTIDTDSTSGDTSSSFLSSRSPGDISKEELMSVLSKMNKRVKGLNAIRVNLTNELNKSEKDKQRLLDLVKTEFLTPADVEEAERSINVPSSNGENEKAKNDEIMMLQRAWRVVDERKSLMLQQLQTEYKVIAMKNSAQIEKIKKQHEKEMEQLQLELKSTPSTNGNDGGTSNIDTSKELEEYKQQSDKAHQLEITQMKEEMKSQQEAKLSRVKELVKLQQKKNDAKMQAVKDQYEKQLQNLNEQHSSELETKVQKAKTDAQASAAENEKASNEESTDKIADLNQQLASIKSSHETEIETLRKELNLESKKIAEKLNEELITALEQQKQEYMVEIGKYQQTISTKENEVAKFKQDLENQTMEFETNQSKQSTENESNINEIIQRTKDECKKDFEQRLSDVRDEMIQSHTSQLESVVEKTKESMKENFETQFKTEASKQIDLHKAEMESFRAELIQSHSETTEEQKEQMEKKIGEYQENLEKAKKELEALQESHAADTAKLSEEKASEIEEMNTSTEKKISQLKEEHDLKISALKEQEAAKIEKLQSDFNAQLSSSLEGKLDESDLNQTREEFENKIKDIETKAAGEIEELNNKLKDSESDFNTRLQAIRDEQATDSAQAQEQTDSEIARLKEELEALQESHAVDTAKLSEEKASEIEEINASTEKKISEMKKEHESALEAKDKDKTNYAAKVKTLFEGKLQSIKKEYASMIVKLETDSKEKEDQLNQTQTKLISANEQTAYLLKGKEDLEIKLRDKISSEKSLNSAMSTLEKELQQSIKNSTSTASSLLGEQQKLQIEKTKLTKELAETKKSNSSNRNLVEELTGKVQALSTSLNCMAEEKKYHEEKLESSEITSEKLKKADKETVALREEVTKLKLNLTSSNGIVSRLQTEKDVKEREHGERTARFGKLETQVAELSEANADIQGKLEASKYEISQKDEELILMKDQLNEVQKKMTELSNSRARKAATESAVTKQSTEKDAHKNKMIESLKREVQSLTQKTARKSMAAQKMLQEKEAECKELRKTNKLLQREVDMGSLSDRRIFELAEKQSGRESVATAEIEIRDKMMNRFAHALSERDGELAEAEYNVRNVKGKVEELGRVKRREGINIDYLKSTVVQYLSKPPGSSERAALLPVLATLLQFEESDYKAIEEGKQKVSWLWGQINPTIIKNPIESIIGQVNGDEDPEQEHLNQPEQSSTNSIRGNGSTPSKRSSLQF